VSQRSCFSTVSSVVSSLNYGANGSAGAHAPCVVQ
jgi:hypothetical protein